MARGMKTRNEYACALTSYDRTPKAVFAAIAYAFAARIIADHDSPTIESAILHEWHVLHENGIVPQEPPK